MNSDTVRLSASDIEREASRITDRIVPGGDVSNDRRSDFVESFRAFAKHIDIRLERIIDVANNAGIDISAIENINDDNRVNKSLTGIHRRERSKRFIKPYIQWLLHDCSLTSRYIQFCDMKQFSVCKDVGFLEIAAIPSKAALDKHSNLIISSTEAIKNSTRALEVLHELRNTEGNLDEMRQAGSLGNEYFAEGAVRLHNIKLIEHFVYNSLGKPLEYLAEPLANLYLVGHWADLRAHKSNRDFNPLARSVLRNCKDLSNPSVALLALEYAHNCKIFGDHEARAWALGKFDNFEALAKQKEVCTLFKQRTDDMLVTTGDDAAHLIDILRINSNINRAYAYRCAACRTLAADRIDLAAANASQARVWFDRAASEAGTILSAEDKMIPIYLDVIELMIDVAHKERIVSDHIERLDKITNILRRADYRALTLRAALYDLKAQYILQTYVADMESFEPTHAIQYNDVFDLFTRSFDLMKDAVPDFCIFDMNDIMNRYKSLSAN